MAQFLGITPPKVPDFFEGVPQFELTDPNINPQEFGFHRRQRRAPGGGDTTPESDVERQRREELNRGGIPLRYVTPGQFRAEFGFVPGEGTLEDFKQFVRDLGPMGQFGSHEQGVATLRSLGMSDEALGQLSRRGQSVNTVAAAALSVGRYGNLAKETTEGRLADWEKQYGRLLGSAGTILASRQGQDELELRRETLLAGGLE